MNKDKGKHRLRKDITRARCEKYIKKYGSMVAAAKELNCSISLLSNIMTGKRFGDKPKSNQRLCSCCGVRPVPDDSQKLPYLPTRLCLICYKGGNRKEELPGAINVNYRG